VVKCVAEVLRLVVGLGLAIIIALTFKTLATLGTWTTLTTIRTLATIRTGTTLTTLWAVATLTTGWAFHIAFGLRNEHTMREFVLTCLLINLQ
jgi:hypothetical protein